MINELNEVLATARKQCTDKEATRKSKAGKKTKAATKVGYSVIIWKDFSERLFE